jgi:hypothetical protein
MTVRELIDLLDACPNDDAVVVVEGETVLAVAVLDAGHTVELRLEPDDEE